MKKIIVFAIAAAAVICNAQSLKFDFANKKWVAWNANGFIGATSLDKTVGRTAPGSLKITLGPKNPINRSCCFLYHLPIKPGKSYTVSVWYKTKNTAADVNVSMSFQGLDAKRQFLNNGIRGTNKKAAGEWTRLIYSVNVPAKGNKWDQAAFLMCTLGASNSENGEVWFDDFEFQEDSEDDEE